MIDPAKNYFELFGLKPAFEVDKQQLSKQYRALQKQLHPDKFASHSASEKRLSVQFTALINNAFQVLKSPLQRAEYLLELSGHPVNSENLTISGRDFLFKQMEWRETLVEIADDNDPVHQHQAIEHLAKTVDEEKQSLLDKFNHTYQQQDYTQAIDLVAKLHFVEKMSTEIDRLEDNILAG